MNTIILDNKYEIKDDDIIGKGGFGNIYLGNILLSNQKIAIKVDKQIKYLKKESKIYDMINDGDLMAKK